MKVSLHYGQGQISLEIPQENVVEIIRPRHLGLSHTSDAEIVRRAISDGGGDLCENAAGRTVGVLLPDGTRDLSQSVILPQLLPLMKNAKKVLFFICTGTHSGDTPENQKIIEQIQAEARKVDLQAYEIIVHDCRGASFVSAGSTARGTEILYHARLQEPAVFAVLSDVKHHYFAGYSNPVKNFVPGLCAFNTVEQNHSWTMDAASCAGVHPWHPEPERRENPLAQDQLEAMTMIAGDRPVWALVTRSTGGQIEWAAFGPAQQVTGQAFLKADRFNCFSAERVSKMIISPGGLPNDVDLYIAQRALELTGGVVCDGGEILFLSACPKGVGNPRTAEEFYSKLIRPLDAIEASDRKQYKLFSHKPWRFAALIRRLRQLWLYSEIDDSEIEKIHMSPCADPQTVINGWLAENPQEKILIVDSANKVLLRQTI